MYPGGQTPGPFVAAYENMRSVTDGLFQSILFTLFQLYLQIYKTSSSSIDYVLILSTAISIARGTRTFMYLESLSVAYQRSKFSLILELVDVGSSYKWPKWLEYGTLMKANVNIKTQKSLKNGRKTCINIVKDIVLKYSGLSSVKKTSYPPVSSFICFIYTYSYNPYFLT